MYCPTIFRKLSDFLVSGIMAVASFLDIFEGRLLSLHSSIGRDSIFGSAICAKTLELERTDVQKPHRERVDRSEVRSLPVLQAAGHIQPRHTQSCICDVVAVVIIFDQCLRQSLAARLPQPHGKLWSNVILIRPS